MDGGWKLIAKPGRILRGSAVFGLVVWLVALVVVSRIPGIGWGTFLSALAMTLLFTALLVGHLSSEIQAQVDGLRARTFFRKLQCRWNNVRHVEVRPFMPGLTIYLVSTTRGPFVFTSLWRNHRELLDALRERVGHG
ncbi:hypothetical protein [Vulgatibacter incomptus]|uniref:PH domain-containing protein n=1 Tax=Vulgatibacter incomptus TaxID=1391653 RepID=A0A0K1PB35_9BACT|nr:hypothetical protein [Vulgatibacter incomptus]AKU90725.1 hypothetical protein AKJ08_1112 [Vulgatibacter incomptus]